MAEGVGWHMKLEPRLDLILLIVNINDSQGVCGIREAIMIIKKSCEENEGNV